MFKRLLNKVPDRITIKYNKERYENILEDPESKLGKIGNSFVLSLVILSVIVLAFESIDNYGDIYVRPIFFVNFFISAVFLVEYTYRFLRAKKKLRFVKDTFNIIDLLSFLPFFIQLFSGIEYLRVLRLLRIFRLFDFMKHTPVLFWFVKSTKNYKNEYQAITSLISIILVVVSVLVYHFETPVNPQFSSIPEAFWWAIVTMTTVGYGDMYPITPMGKIIGSIIIFLGPALVAVVSSITILIFMDVAEVQKKINNMLKGIITCPKCKAENLEKANYCYNCGNKLKETSEEGTKIDLE